MVDSISPEIGEVRLGLFHCHVPMVPAYHRCVSLGLQAVDKVMMKC